MYVLSRDSELLLGCEKAMSREGQHEAGLGVSVPPSVLQRIPRNSDAQLVQELRPRSGKL